MWLVAAFLYHVCHLCLRHSFQKQLRAAHVTPYSHKLLNGEHSALHGLYNSIHLDVWQSRLQGSFPVSITTDSAPGLIDFLLKNANGKGVIFPLPFFYENKGVLTTGPFCRPFQPRRFTCLIEMTKKEKARPDTFA